MHLVAPSNLSAILLKLPITIIERADLSCLEPTRDAVEMKSVLIESIVLAQQKDQVLWDPYIANTPGNSTFFTRGGGLVSLALYA